MWAEGGIELYQTQNEAGAGAVEHHPPLRSVSYPRSSERFELILQLVKDS